MDKKRVYGQFFTKDEVWLKPQIVDFIKMSNCKIAYDPFAGEGDLLTSVAKKCGNITDVVGLDIDEKLNWRINDSLIRIPHIDGAIIITNPPYISNYSASRKRISNELKKYFDSSRYTDIYLIALDRMLESQNNIVAIIPETFINSPFKKKDLLSSITILEDNPFGDTETPVAVACFDGVKKDFSKIKIYKNEKLVSDFGRVEKLRLLPDKKIKIEFNDKNGWLAVRCVDTTNPKNMIRFDRKENIEYDWEHRIKFSSRLLTLVNIDIPDSDRTLFIEKCNEYLCDIRSKTCDVILSPFKGNMKNGRRRRRLDFLTCRAILEKVYESLYGYDKYSQTSYCLMDGDNTERAKDA